ncbi:MAG: ATP-binding cassette domain-containing protein [Bilifractor sp.]
MLELKNICKEYRVGDTVQKALDHASLTLADTEFVAILGPSGSGKTTLLNIIGGLDRYNSGDLIIDGISTKDYTDRDWDAYRNHAIGFVFQSYNLIMHQSVLSNVELALTISGVSGEERRKRAEEALVRVGLGDQIHKKPNQLSGGQMQRVAIARALVNNPRIVLADEPTGALDSGTSIQVMNILKEIARDRLVVMVTHNPDLAEKYATRIVTIKDGHIAGSRDLPQNAPDFSSSASIPEDTAVSENTPETGKTFSSAGQKAPAGRSVKNGKFRRTSMKFLTALELSFQNLRTKKARTIMVAFAGSIGIIGIALILAIETGLQQYVKTTESATLSQYPIEIYSTGIDWQTLLSETPGTSLSMSGLSGQSSDESVKTGSGEISVNPLAKNIFTGMNSNDLASLKKYLESDETDIRDYATDIEYRYGVEPQIYETTDDGEIEQLNPNRMLSDMLTSIIDVSSMMNGFVGESLFHPMPTDSSLYRDSYDVKAGRWPKNNHELVLVLTGDGHISDFLLYELGIMDTDELREMIREFSSGSDNSLLAISGRAASAIEENGGSEQISVTGSSSEDASSEESSAVSSVSSSSYGGEKTFRYSDFLGRKFKMILASDTFVYDPDMGVWNSRADDDDFIKQLVQNGEDLEIVGIVQAKKDASNRMLTSGLAYPGDLISEIIRRESKSEPVRAQLEHPDINIFTGKKFTDESGSDLDLRRFVSLDHDDVAKAFHVTTDSASTGFLQDYLSSEIDKMASQIVQYASDKAEGEMDQISLSDFIDLDQLQKQIPQLTDEDLEAILNAAFSDLSEEALVNAMQELGSGWLDSLKEKWEKGESSADQSEWMKIAKSLGEYISGYLVSDDARQVIQDQLQQILEQNASDLSSGEIQSMMQDEIQAYVSWVSSANADRSPDEQLNADDPAVISLYLASSDGQQRLSALAASLSGKTIQISDSQMQQISAALLQSFTAYAAKQGTPDLTSIGNELSRELAESFADYITQDSTKSAILSAVRQTLSGDAFQNAVHDAVKEKIAGLEANVSDEIASEISEAAGGIITSFADDVANQAKKVVLGTIREDSPELADKINQNIGDFFTVDEDAFRQAIRVNAGMAELQSILESFLGSDKATLSENLTSLGYADLESPTEILIYPKDFDAKNHIADRISEYNDTMRARGEDDKVITYSDVIATMMQSVTDIINSISRILIAFVSISLVVSSIMIGVITYISVLERKKEIGILRAIGASKHNISEVFNAETVITGFISGCLGIGITFALIPLANLIIRNKTGQVIRAVLPPLTAAALVLLSVILTLLAGLIPSGRAAKSDPVEALRSE